MDQDKIDTLLAGPDTIVIDIERQYPLGDIPGVIGSVVSIDFPTGTTDYLASLKNVIDIAGFKHEENAIVWNVVYNISTKEFDLTSSYVRTQKDTSTAATAITTGQLLKAVFQTPGFDGPVKTVIDLPFGQSISAPDAAAMLAVGLELDLSVTGDLFSIKTQSVPFKVSFMQPDAVTENYVIDFPLNNQLIEI